MAFTDDGVTDWNEARDIYALMSPKLKNLDLVMLLESKGTPTQGECLRKFPDGKPRLEIEGYYWGAQVMESASKVKVVPGKLYVARHTDGATAKVGSIVRSKDDKLKVIISGYKAGGDQHSIDAQPMFELELTDAVISFFQINSGSHSGLPVELMSFRYRSMTLRTAAQMAIGIRGAVNECTFDFNDK